IVHLDVKPANFLLSGPPDQITAKTPWLLLADFGHAVRLPPPDEAWVDEGDRAYLAAEVMKGVITPKADVFSLGMMMLEIVAEVVLPPNGDVWQDLRDGYFNDPALACLPYSKHLVDTIKLMLLPDYEHRPTIDEIIATAQKALLSPAISDRNDEDDDDDDDDFFRPARLLQPAVSSAPVTSSSAAGLAIAPMMLPRRPMLRSATASGAYQHHTLLLSDLVTRPASAGPGPARRTASAPGTAVAPSISPSTITTNPL
ncbi:mitosis inhibitor protein kinase swe1, partial [Coemansia aciculifera]